MLRLRHLGMARCNSVFARQKLDRRRTFPQ